MFSMAAINEENMEPSSGLEPASSPYKGVVLPHKLRRHGDILHDFGVSVNSACSPIRHIFRLEASIAMQGALVALA